MLWIFELANNHDGSVEHAKRIIDQFAEVKDDYGIQAAVKIQLRQLETFIHKDYQDSDLKYVKRFRSTRLSMQQFREILDHARSKGFLTVATPFDNESLPWIDELDIDIVKVASCSCDDWPLLNGIAAINKKIIISTAGATMDTLKQVYNLFYGSDREFAFMHCVGEYPTQPVHANLDRIDELRRVFPRIEIGISTHEHPSGLSVVPFAAAKGCTIVEKHVNVETDEHKPNAYSAGPEHMAEVIEMVRMVEVMCTPPRSLQNERESLRSLKRGVYSRKTVRAGEAIREGDLYYAMPCHADQMDASQAHLIVGNTLEFDLGRDEAVSNRAYRSLHERGLVNDYVNRAIRILERSRLPFSPDDDVELSVHYGLDRFEEAGALIINKVNRAYCKKLIVMLAGQRHPSHHHIKKEETFELLDGDCTLVLNGKEVIMHPGTPVLIVQGAVHSFSSRQGCVIEEVSTTHHKGDSIYDDPRISKLQVSDRKVRARLVKTRT